MVTPGLPSAAIRSLMCVPSACRPRIEQRIEIVVVRIALRRRPRDRPGRAALVVVVEQLRKPLVIERAVDVLGLGLGRGEEVAVVVVADVLLVEPRQVGEGPQLRVLVAHVPVGDQLVAVRVGVHEENDAVVQEAQRLLVVAADHLVDHLGELLGAERLGRVQAAVDPHHRLPFLRQRARLVVGQPLGERQPPRDLLVARKLPVILRRSDDRHPLRPPFGGLPHVLEDHPVRLFVERLPVGLDLRVVGELVVVADVEAERLFRRGDVRGARLRCPRRLRSRHGSSRERQQDSDTSQFAHGAGFYFGMEKDGRARTRVFGRLTLTLIVWSLPLRSDSAGSKASS